MKLRLPELTLLIIGILSILAFIGKAQKPSNEILVQKQSAQDASAPSSTDLTTITVLRTQIEVMQKYDERLLSVVYWSLSGVFLLVILVGGINWFTNYRVYERERDILRDEVLAASTRNIESLNALFERLKEDDQRRLDDEFKTQRNEMHEVVSNSAKSVRARIREDIEDLKNQMLDAQMKSLTFQAENYQMADKKFLAFRTWIEYLEVVKARGLLDFEHFVGTTVQKLCALLQGGLSITYDLHVRAVELIKEAPESLAGELGAFRALLDAARKFN